MRAWDERRDRCRRWTMVGSAAVVALALSAGLLLRSSPPGWSDRDGVRLPGGLGLDGLSTGLPGERQVDGAAAPTEVIDLDTAQLQLHAGPARGLAEPRRRRGRPASTSGGTSRSTSHADSNPRTSGRALGATSAGILANTNPAPWLDIRITLDRLAVGSATLPPLLVKGELPIPMTVPVDPADPDGPTTVEMHAGRLRLRHPRRRRHRRPTSAAFDIVISDRPAEPAPTPATSGCGSPPSTASAANPPPPSSPPAPSPRSTRSCRSARRPTSDRDLDLAIAWDRAPAQLGFDKATTCTAAVPAPGDRLGLPRRPGRLEQRPARRPTPTSTSSPASGQGFAGHDAFGLHGTVEHVPEELTLELTETNALTAPEPARGERDVPRLVAGAQPRPRRAARSPASRPRTRGRAPTKLGPSGRVTALPPSHQPGDRDDAATGALKSVDLRFCPGTSWTVAACQADVRSPESIELIASDVLPGESTALPALPPATDPYVAYTERDVRRHPVAGQSDKHFRFGGRLAERVEHLNVQTPPAFTQRACSSRCSWRRTCRRPSSSSTPTGGRSPSSAARPRPRSGVGFNGEIAPFPAKATVAFGKTRRRPWCCSTTSARPRRAVRDVDLRR